MTVNIHSPNTEDLDNLMKNLPDLKVVGAHPGERKLVLERVELMKRYKNLHWDISGTGLFRWGMLRYMVEQCGADRFLFGTDFPICNIAMQVYGVLTERISEEAKLAIFSGNYDRLSGRS
jgi:predicted TIM-barrel fold metal-dependent hydrolase